MQIAEKTLKDAVEELTPAHYGYIKNIYGFPGQCDWSSHMVGSYLKLLGFPAEVVYGTFGPHDLFHAWIKIGEMILDFTLFQFLGKKGKLPHYQKIDKTELISYVKKIQGDYWIDKHHESYNDYKEITIMDYQFLNDVKPNEMMNYQTFYSKIWLDGGYHRYGIKTAIVKGKNKTFEQLLDEDNKRIGKKFFTKFCIVKK